MLLANFLFAQPNDEFLTEFLFGNELKLQNELGKYNQFDFSGLWTKTENYLIFGVIGQDHQRIRMKLISVEKSPINENVYFVYGKSKVKEIICDFKG